MKQYWVAIFVLIFSPQLLADAKVLVKFVGDDHQIIRVVEYPGPKFDKQKANQALVPASNRVQLNYKSAQKPSSLTIADPRIIRLPLLDNQSAHSRPIIRDEGVYVLTLKGDNIDLKSLSLNLSGQQVQVKYSKKNIILK
ncbi:hypothetical protein FLL45_01265 [Aliikangiella marina]|uniref:Copper chaperone PCu(A)C n=1 Tax=Aliikangiella marina TaxID=1712262 RepID=A0A545THF4_9GAMM|nr:hypothetical protein [Aliikangiella marina]TQV76616.1 hypothetical protein FLL45_01265 [Aliikangiella marina]